jgi:hypothetical protein
MQWFCKGEIENSSKLKEPLHQIAIPMSSNPKKYAKQYLKKKENITVTKLFLNNNPI